MIEQEQQKIEEENQILLGEGIKKIFQHGRIVAKLHSAITSPRGKYFRRNLLYALQEKLSEEALQEFVHENGLRDLTRHLNKLLRFKLIREVEKKEFERTELGEEAVNTVRRLERKIGQERAEKIFEAGLGPNSIRLFLKVFGNDREADLKTLEIIYSPIEMGRLTLFLPRSIEGLAAIDKLDDAGLVSYTEENNIHVNPRRSSSFYHYLRDLYWILEKVKLVQ